MTYDYAEAYDTVELGVRQKLAREYGKENLGDWIHLATPDVELWSVQEEICRALSVPRSIVCTPSCNSSGKGLRQDQRVLTPGGWRAAGDIQAGDILFGRDGRPTRVTAVFDRGPLPLYEVIFSDGARLIVDEDHLWPASWYEPVADRWHRVTGVRSMGDLFAAFGEQPRGLRGWAVPLCEPVQMPVADLPMDPYALGILLGDGCFTGSGSVTVNEADEPDVLPHIAHMIGRRRQGRGCGEYTLRGAVRSSLTDLGVWPASSLDKHVPESYLWAHVEARVALAQGLLDSDGGISGAGIEFSSSSEKLAVQALEVFRSLGAYASIRRRATTHHDSWRIYIRPRGLPFIPFRSSRKRSAWEALCGRRQRGRDPRLRHVASVRSVEPGESVCFLVDHPEHLFIAEGHIVTHNTWLAGRLILAFFDTFPQAKVVTSSSTWDHLKDELWGEVRIAYEQARWRIGHLYPGALKVIAAPDHYIIGRSPESTEAIQGYHSSHVLVVIDEATSVDPKLALGLETLRSSGDVRVLCLFNPTDESTWVYRLCQQPNVAVIPIPYDRTPNFTGEHVPKGSSLINQAWLDDLRNSGHGPGTLMWTTRVEAKFWVVGEDKTITTKMWEDAYNTPARGGPLVLGIDLAPYGDNENVICHRRGNIVERIESFPAMRQDIFWGDFVGPRVRELKPSYVIYDGDGVGAGVFESATRACGEERLVIVRGGIVGDPHYQNMRAQWWWRLRTMFENARIHVSPVVQADERLKKQMCDIKYGFTAKGSIRIESKDDIKRRSLESPDRADSVMYAFAWDAPDAADERQSRLDRDRSDEAMWSRDAEEFNRRPQQTHPVLGSGTW